MYDCLLSTLAQHGTQVYHQRIVHNCQCQACTWAHGFPEFALTAVVYVFQTRNAQQ